MKTKILIAVGILTLLLATATPTKAEPDPQLIRYIAQEHQKTKDYVKTEIQQQIKNNNEDIQKQIDWNKQIFFKELRALLREWTIRLAVIWFSTTLLALISYRLIMMRITRKYRHIKFRDEILG